MSAYEMMLSESQERMLAICEPAKLPHVQEILRKWDLDAACARHTRQLRH